MKNRFASLTLASVLLAGAGCTGGMNDPHRTPQNAVYRERAGLVTESDLFTRLPRVLARHGYLIEGGNHHGGRILFETQWKQRAPFEDERAEGYEAARTRVRFRATWDGRLYVLQMEVENVLLTAGGAWVRGRMTEMFDSYAHAIASDVRLEIASGIRRY